MKQKLASPAHPWTEDEVASLKGYQECGFGHEFTGPDGKPLIPTATGWTNENGVLMQNWAHAFMLDWSWREHA